MRAPPAAAYVNWVGRTAPQVREEAALGHRTSGAIFALAEELADAAKELFKGATGPAAAAAGHPGAGAPDPGVVGGDAPDVRIVVVAP